MEKGGFRNMLISIIVPVYNVEKYLPICIESLINQTDRDIEIILVDDGSPDNCPALCDEYAQKDNRIKVIHKENGGLSDARNAGMAIATGDYLMFVDSDDYIEVDACEKIQQNLQNGADIILCDGINEGGNVKLEHYSEDCFEMTGEEYLYQATIHKKLPVVVWLNVYKREFIENNKLFFKKGYIHEDEDFTPRALLKAQKVIHTPIFLYHYVDRDESITKKTDRRRNVDHTYQIMNELIRLYNEYPFNDMRLKNKLIDFSVRKYLHIYGNTNAYQYENCYTHKWFCIKNSKTAATFLKSLLFSVSPCLFCKTKRLL